MSVSVLAFTEGLRSLSPTYAGEPNSPYTLVQVVPPQSTWEDYMREILKRVHERLGGNPDALAGLPLKSALSVVKLEFALYGLPSGLTPIDLEQIDADAMLLIDCAETDPPPPDGTSYSLIVNLHDLGKQIYTAASDY